MKETEFATPGRIWQSKSDFHTSKGLLYGKKNVTSEEITNINPNQADPIALSNPIGISIAFEIQT